MIAIVIGTILASVATGGLGLIDFIKGFMALNWLFVIPIGGFIVGIGVGALQAYTCFFLNRPVTKAILFAAALGAGFAYISADLSCYFTKTITITPAITDKVPPGTYKMGTTANVRDVVEKNEVQSRSIDSSSSFPHLRRILSRKYCQS